MSIYGKRRGGCEKGEARALLRRQVKGMGRGRGKGKGEGRQ